MAVKYSETNCLPTYTNLHKNNMKHKTKST